MYVIGQNMLSGKKTHMATSLMTVRWYLPACPNVPTFVRRYRNASERDTTTSLLKNFYSNAVRYILTGQGLVPALLSIAVTLLMFARRSWYQAEVWTVRLYPHLP